MRPALQSRHPILNRRFSCVRLLGPTARWRCDPFPLFLAICSAWAAGQMWLWPNDFLGTCGHLATWPSDHLRTWAAWCGFAALLKLAGLLFHAIGRRQRVARALMIIGLFMSVLWWTIVASFFAIRMPHTVSPIVFIGLAFGAAWQLTEWNPGRGAAQ